MKFLSFLIFVIFVTIAKAQENSKEDMHWSDRKTLPATVLLGFAFNSHLEYERNFLLETSNGVLLGFSAGVGATLIEKFGAFGAFGLKYGKKNNLFYFRYFTVIDAKSGNYSLKPSLGFEMVRNRQVDFRIGIFPYQDGDQSLFLPDFSVGYNLR